MTNDTILAISRLLISLTLLLIAGLIFFTPATEADRAIAGSLLGTVVGYWLNHAESAVITKADTSIK